MRLDVADTMQCLSYSAVLYYQVDKIKMLLLHFADHKLNLTLYNFLVPHLQMSWTETAVRLFMFMFCSMQL